MRDDSGRTRGTLLLEVMEAISLATDRHLVVCKFLSASDGHYRWWATEGPGRGLSPKAHYHFCEGNSHSCPLRKDNKKVIHCERFRLITPKEVRDKIPGWAFSRGRKQDVAEEFRLMLEAEDLARAAPQLPWLASQEGKDAEPMDEDSPSSEEEGLSERISKMKADLAAAETRAKQKADRKKAERAAMSPEELKEARLQAKLVKDKKRRLYSPSGDERGKGKSSKAKSKTKKADGQEKEEEKGKEEEGVLF